MQIRRIVAAAVVVLPLGAVFAVAGTAQAAGTPKGVGPITCAVGGYATFTPPLTPDGTPGFKHEVIQFNLSASGCTGPDTDTPQPVPTSASITTKPIKVKDIGKGSSRVAGACGNDNFNPTITLKSINAWSGGAAVATTKSVIGPMTSTSSATEAGLTGTGTTKRSYGAAASMTLYMTDASATGLKQACGQGGSGAPLSEIDFDSTTSSLTFGPVATQND